MLEPSFISWPDIEGFHNIRKAMSEAPAALCESWLSGRSQITYRGKVKLHGTNGAVQVLKDGSVYAQSRSAILDLEKGQDNAGFARWVLSQKDAFAGASGNQLEYILYGEWCGPGVQAGVAANKTLKRFFAVFALADLQGEEFITDPEAILSWLPHLKNVPDLYILPWDEHEIVIDWLAPSRILESVAAEINARVAAVEKCDPWVQATFGLEGVGEGLVYYPISSPHNSRTSFKNLSFKAKGEQHRVVRQKAAAQIDPERAASVQAFAALVLTEARLEQGVRAVTGSAEGPLSFDMKMMGSFLKWVGNDVQKETSAELEASGLDWKAVNKAVADTAKKWFMLKAMQP